MGNVFDCMRRNFSLLNPFRRRQYAPADLPPRDLEPRSANGEYGIYQLYQPPHGKEAVMDIVFFHGLQVKRGQALNAWWSTWVSQTPGGPVCWPRQWLSQAFPGARIWSVCYPANAALQPQDGNQHWETTGIQLLNELLSRDVVVGGGGRQVVLVGHSMGGLILKQVVYEAHHRATALPANAPERCFIDHLRGLVFYATPHVGSFIAEWTQSALINNDIVRTFWGRTNTEILDRLKVFNDSSHLLQGRVNNILKQRVEALCFAEQLKMNLGPLGYHIVVPQASAALNPAAGAQFVHADHSGVCRPPGQTEVSYTALVDYVEHVTGVPAAPAQPADQAVPAAPQDGGVRDPLL